MSLGEAVRFEFREIDTGNFELFTVSHSGQNEFFSGIPSKTAVLSLQRLLNLCMPVKNEKHVLVQQLLGDADSNHCLNDVIVTFVGAVKSGMPVERAVTLTRDDYDLLHISSHPNENSMSERLETIE